MKLYQKILLICLLVLVIFSGSFVFAQRDLEIDYPGFVVPTSGRNVLPAFIIWLFNFSISIAGLIAFGSLIYGGLRYVTSVGSPSALDEAKSQILAGILGLVILLSSYLILTAINPQLVILKIDRNALGRGVALYPENNCQGEPLSYGVSISDLTNFEVKSIKLLSSGLSLDVYTHENKNYEGREEKVDGDNPSETCIGSLSFRPLSISFIWEPPGVYLYENTDFTVPPSAKIYQGSASSFGNFDNKAHSIKFKGAENGINFGAVLHEYPNSAGGGQCSLFLEESANLGDEIIGINASSITVFNPISGFGTGGVTFYQNKNFVNEWEGTEATVQREFDNSRQGYCVTDGVPNDATESIEINGDYLVVLFENDDCTGKCQVFTKSNPNLRDEPIGRCTGDYDHCPCILFWCPPCLGSCVSSVLVLPILPLE